MIVKAALWVTALVFAVAALAGAYAVFWADNYWGVLVLVAGALGALFTIDTALEAP